MTAQAQIRSVTDQVRATELALEGVQVEELVVSRTLLDVHPLAVGDLVYLPRGTMHRGLGGVLAQVITAPGFKPGAEIGVDHHLFAINERLGLVGDDALPLHAANARQAVVKYDATPASATGAGRAGCHSRP